jgi:signal transduction histidine kinase
MVNENGKEQVIFSIEPLNDGGFLLGSNELIYTSNNFKKIIVLPIPDGADEKIKKISAGKNHIYFCNGSKYIYNFNPVAKKISKYEPVASGIKIGQIKSFYLRNDGNLMLLNKENQIFLQVESEKDNKILFKPFLMDSRNFNNYPINEILYENANDIWFETSKSGIWKYSFQNQNFMQFDRRYGINMDNFVLKATSTTANDEILLGGKHKFAIIKPGFFDNLNVDPKIVLTGFKMFDEEKMLNDEINNLEELDLSYTDNYFTLEFACLDFTDAANNQFKYKLEGFDKDWINSRNIRSASYTNLPGGRYRFRVIGANSEGKWDLVGKSIILNIERPPWKRWYAYLLSVLIPSTIIFIFIYYRSQKNKEKIALIKKYAGDMLTIQEKERARISRDVHDAATQQVVAAKMKLNIFRDGGDTHEEIINAEALLEESIKNLREISHDLHPAILQDLGLKRALKNLFHKFSNRTGINTQIENLDLPDELPDDLSINIYRIIQESLNNIEKHSGAKNVKFVYNTYDDKIIFSVKDDGAGFDVQSVLHDKERTSLGLRNITERVNYFEGVYEIWSDKKSGTEIKITLPLKKNK